jgi:hypothetical protein
MKETKVINGKKYVYIVKAIFQENGFDVGICRNGFQTTVVSVDEELLKMLKEAIDKFMED